MERSECSYPSYQRIISSDLYEKILDKKEFISTCRLYACLSPEEGDLGDKILKESREIYLDPNRGISQESLIAKDILDLEKKLGESFSPSMNQKKYFREHPSFLTRVILEKNPDHKKYDFPSLKSMQKAISTFCMENDHLFSFTNEDYVWLNEKFKNTIYLNIHGDFFVSQTNIQEKETIEKTLFGQIPKFKSTIINPSGNGLSSYQSSSGFLWSLLKYSEKINKNKIPEIVNWEKTLEEIGSVYTATTECMFGGGSLPLFLTSTEIIDLENPIQKVLSPTISPLSESISYTPAIDKEKKLLFLKYDEKYSGNISVKYPRGTRTYTKTLEFTKNDLPDLLKATYRLFTRDKTILPKIMKHFLKNS
ncbi:hypothetical protein HOD29_04125 [archaeon]|jgi:hypothetical protein|nr:hypothetical protein [archaeon]